VGEFADGNLPRDADGYVDWYKKNKKGVPAWKRIEFVDTEAPKGKQRFKWEGLKGQVDNAFGSGFFARNTKGYDLAALDSQRMFKGEKIGTLVRDKMLMKRLKNKIFESEGVRRQPTQLEIDNFMKRNRPSFTMSQGHHVEGVGNNPYKVEPAFQVANQKLEALRKDYAKGRIDKATFIKKMSELPGGIRYKVDDVLEGVKSTEAMRTTAAMKEAGFKKTSIMKFRKQLNQGAVNFAKKIEGTEIARKICSAKANGGVAGCLNLAKKNPAKFMSRAIALGLAGELAAELAFAAPGYAAGKTGSELLGESIFGIFGAGTTFNEELAKYADPKAKELIDLQEDIAQLEKQASVIGASEAGLEGETELQKRMMPGYLKGAESAVERLPIFEDPATTAAYSKAMEKYLAAQKERAKSLPRKAVSKVVEAIKTPFIEGIKDVGQSPGLFKSGGKVDYDNYLPDIDDDN
jgi:hypothetical protein